MSENITTADISFYQGHYDDVIMTMLASQITSLMVVYSIVYLGVNQRKHQSSASLALVREIHRGPVNFPHKWPVTRKMFPLDDVIMERGRTIYVCRHTKNHTPSPASATLKVTLNVRGPSYPGLTRSISWVLMIWRRK